MTQLSFDEVEATRRREEGIALVDSHTPEIWKSLATGAIRGFAILGRPFTADDVVEAIGEPPHPNALGARFLVASKEGIIRMTGERRRSKRPSTHGRYQQVWAGA